ELVVVAVQIVDAGGDDLALEVLPRTLADAVPCIDGGVAFGGLGAQVGAPGLAACAGAAREFLAIPVGALDAAEIGTFAGPKASHEERHVRRLRVLLLRLCLQPES